jgi:hypothetical protein
MIALVGEKNASATVLQKTHGNDEAPVFPLLQRWPQ